MTQLHVAASSPEHAQLLSAPASSSLQLPGRLFACREKEELARAEGTGNGTAGTAAFHLTELPGQVRTALGYAGSAPGSPREVEEPAGCWLQQPAEPSTGGAPVPHASELGNPLPQQGKPTGRRRGEQRFLPVRLWRHPHATRAEIPKRLWAAGTG